MKLIEYFLEGAVDCLLGETTGMEIETQFIDINTREPITLEISQRIINELVSRYGWIVVKRKGLLIAEIESPVGDKILYELGKHNIELGTIPLPPDLVVRHARIYLELLYDVAARHKAMPLFQPMINNWENRDLLVVPDERDATWLALDGRNALNLLAGCSAVQFTIDVTPTEAIKCLNLLGAATNRFLRDYPQEVLWRGYIRKSRAGYDPSRYGGPLIFRDLENYCERLERQRVIKNGRLVSSSEVQELDTSLFLRSVWWYFRLRRYGQKLCIEIRPLARREDDCLQKQLDFVMSILTVGRA